MKKLICLLLIAAFVLGLGACAPADSAGTTTATPTDTTAAGIDGRLSVGYGKVQIDPTESVPMRGYGSTEKRMSTGLRSHLYQIAIAITDAEGNTAIVIASDMCSISTATANSVRTGIENQCGVRADNVIISALHQHSTPDMDNNKVGSSGRYRDEIFIPGAIAAAKAALENRAPVTAVQTTSVETERMNFVRHYVMEDGSYAGPNFGNLKLTAVDHATEADQIMQLVKFVRKGQTTAGGEEAKDIILTNYQGHPLMGTTSIDTNIHSDLIGIFRDELEKELDCQAIYFSGASGNMMFTSMISEENKTSDYKDHGKTLAKLAIKAEDTYTDVELSAVKTAKVTYTGKCNHTEDHLLEKARKVWDEYQQNGDVSIFRANGFQSQYHCSLLISHASLPEEKSFHIFGIGLGDIVIVSAPYEMFCDTGMAIKAASPFKNTIVCTIANGANGYLPTEQAWDYYCYERHNSDFVRGTAEEVEAAFTDMIKKLHEQY